MKRSQPSSFKGYNPTESKLIPWVQKHLTQPQSAAKLNANQQVSAGESTPPTNVPGFGAFLDGKTYSDGLETKCADAPDNCGVFVALSKDFDGDGKVDLAVVQYDGTVNIMLNDGAGGLKDPIVYSPPPNAGVTYATAVDLNGDGYPDIIASDASNTNLIVYLNQGNGTFATPASIPVNTPDDAELDAIGVTDINGDGKPDVVALLDSLTFTDSGDLVTTLTIQTFFGKGDGTFVIPTEAQTTQQTISGQAGFGGMLAFGDFRHRGKSDLVFLQAVTNSSGFFGDVSAVLAEGNGDGTFSAPKNAVIIKNVTRSLGDLRVVDLNADNNPDIAFEGSTGLITALNNGDGTFGAPITAPLSPATLLFDDINGDGYPDLVMNGGTLAVYPGKGDGTFGTPPAEYLDADGTGQGIRLADYNGDGIPDIVEINNNPREASIFLGQGGGKYTAAPLLSSAADPVLDANQLVLQTTGDFNGDGYSDILAVNAGNGEPSLETALSDGTGSFIYKTALLQRQFPTLAYVQPVTADFNGDGRQDIILTGYVGTLAVALANSDGTFANPTSIPLGPLSCVPNYAGTGDLTGSGHQDIVITYPGDYNCGGNGSTPSGYFIVPGKGDGTFGAPQFYPFGEELFSVTIADMNGDGIPDLVLNDEPFDIVFSPYFAVYFLAGKHDDTFGEPLLVSSGNVISQIIAGDLNQDGKPDLVMFSEGAQQAGVTDSAAGIQLYKGRGDGYFDPLTQLAVGNFYESGFLGDVNGDGIPDITAALQGTIYPTGRLEGLTAWLGLGGGYFSPISTQMPRGSTSVAAGHFLPDNTTSFVVQIAYIDAAAIMLNQGGDSLALTPSSSSLSQGDTLTLSASITSTFANGSPTGSISFAAGGVSLGTAPVSNGTAALSTSALSIGTSQITATYSGDTHYNVASATVPVTVVAIQPSISVSSIPPTLTLQPGATGTIAVSVAANNAFTGTVTLSCKGAPQESSCNVAPATIQLTPGQSIVVTAVVSTTPPNDTYQADKRNPDKPSPVDSEICLALALLCILPVRRFRRGITIVVVAFSIAAMGLLGCGGGGSSKAPPVYGGTPAGTYTLNLTATSGSLSSTVPITLKIQ
ncbi:FG-GAP-like repeat-containing protein [Acidobacterium sp. S8]|uniref:FG-GAP-like repeat-containing protein n=1 Tax=Acidobacterium sp. S8 TaxID=1641854 RepID=UPI00131A69E1|nr:FG-GAP-like repeat-containing protein [Acidobacterium sp. S8]